jgi:hypothetical protein
MGEYYRLQREYYLYLTYIGGENKTPTYAGYEEKQGKKLELGPFVTSAQLLEILLDNFLEPAQNSAIVT